jgi:hypothetical protein
MAAWILFGVGAIAVLLLGWYLLRRLARWNDPSLDSPEKQAEAFLWSQRGDGGTL